MEKSNYKLIYFDLRGFGECIKYILAYKGIKYELQTIPMASVKPRWFEFKETLPFGQLPIFEDNGKTLSQSIAICQYLAVKHGLLHRNDWENAQLTAIACSLQDICLRVAKYFYDPNPETKMEFKVKFLDKLIPFYLERYEMIAKKFDAYMSDQLTWLDFYMVAALEFMNGMMREDLISGKFPALEALMDRIKNLPGVKEHVQSRPNYDR